jgi:arylsulfatase A-like enzyme
MFGAAGGARLNARGGAAPSQNEEHDREETGMKLKAAFRALASLAFAVTAGASAASQGAARPPNVIVILADDLGYFDVSAAGNPLVRTPNIDAIARNGARFEAGYAGDAVCSPSRAALLTGRMPQRYGFEYIVNTPVLLTARDGTYQTEDYPAIVYGAPNPPVKPEINGLAPGELTLADMLKAQGYRTGIIGKWHLGGAPNLIPTARGFDEFIGMPQGGGGALYGDPESKDIVNARLPWSGIDNYVWDNVPRQIVKNGERITPPGYLTDFFGEEGVQFIRRNRKSPFFLFMAFNAPHNPLQASRQAYDRLSHIRDERTRVYYAMIESMDDAVGRLQAELRRQRIDKNTIIFFTSDNGGAHYHRIPQENLPYRGWKTTYFEGGLNVPYFVSWPREIPAGSIVRGFASSLDIVPTVMRAAGAPLPTDREFDGVDILPAASGAKPDDLVSRTLVWRKRDYYAIRHGNWKLQVSAFPAMTWLHDLDTDPTERFNVASSRPDMVAKLEALYRERAADFIAPAWPAMTLSRVDIDGHSPDHGSDVEHIYWAN